MQKMKQRIQHSASNFSTPPEKMLSDWAAAVAGGAMIVTMYCWLLRVAMAFVESMTCQQIPLRKPASGKGMTASQIEEQEFDQCVLQRPCRFLGRHGRTTSTLTATNIAYNVVQSWRILVPRVIKLVDSSSGAVAFLLAGSVLLSLGTPFNFLATVFSSPGYYSDAHDDEMMQPLIGWRRCDELGISMPPRSHFCRRCKRIVLRMDHHCAFVNNCIGHGNHHYFLRLLFFAVLATLCESTSCLLVLLYARPSGEAPATLEATTPRLPFNLGPELATLWRELMADEWHEGTHPLVVLWAVSTLTAFLVGALFVVQVHDVSRGATYLEAHAIRVAYHKSAYDQGNASVNLRAILGRSYLRHLLPIPCPPVGDGISFAHRDE